jgi:hypothetical protein
MQSLDEQPSSYSDDMGSTAANTPRAGGAGRSHRPSRIGAAAATAAANAAAGRKALKEALKTQMAVRKAAAGATATTGDEEAAADSRCQHINDEVMNLLACWC